MAKDQIHADTAPESPPAAASSQALDAMTKQIFHVPVTDFHFADGRNRHVTYGADGLVAQIKDSGNTAHANALNNISEWDRLPSGVYKGENAKGSLSSWTPRADTVDVQDDGSILLSTRRNDGKALTADLKPDGSETINMVDKSNPGFKDSILSTSKGLSTDQVTLVNGTKLTMVEDNSLPGKSDTRSIELESHGGTLSIVKTTHGASWQAKDPQGKIDKGTMTETEFKNKFEQWLGQNKLSIDWYKAGPKGVRYDVVTDKSGIGDFVGRELKHIGDII